MIKEIPQKKLMISLLILTILISVFGTLAVLDATKIASKTVEPKTIKQESTNVKESEEPIEQLSSQAGIVSFAIVEGPEK